MKTRQIDIIVSVPHVRADYSTLRVPTKSSVVYQVAILRHRDITALVSID